MLVLTRELANRIRAQGAAAYPHECCGGILGREREDGREVADLLPLANRREDSPRNRFSISPEDFRTAEKAAATRQLQLLGWYHSHPDHPAQPSEYDREHAWPWYSYVIVGVSAGQPKEITSWRLAEDRSRFVAEELVVRSDRAAPATRERGAAQPAKLAGTEAPKASGG